MPKLSDYIKLVKETVQEHVEKNDHINKLQKVISKNMEGVNKELKKTLGKDLCDIKATAIDELKKIEKVLQEKLPQELEKAQDFIKKQQSEIKKVQEKVESLLGSKKASKKKVSKKKTTKKTVKKAVAPKGPVKKKASKKAVAKKK